MRFTENEIETLRGVKLLLNSLAQVLNFVDLKVEELRKLKWNQRNLCVKCELIEEWQFCQSKLWCQRTPRQSFLLLILGWSFNDVGISVYILIKQVRKSRHQSESCWTWNLVLTTTFGHNMTQLTIVPTRKNTVKTKTGFKKRVLFKSRPIPARWPTI